MLLQMTAQPPDGKVVSLILDGSTVVIDKRPAQYRHQRKVAQTALHDPLIEADASNMPWLSTFHQVKLIKARTAEGSIHQFLPRPFDVEHCLTDVLLRACFPRNTLSGLFIGVIQMIEREHFFKAVTVLNNCQFVCFTFCAPSLIPRVTAFFTGHSRLHY